MLLVVTVQLIALVDRTPKPNDVKAGWGAFVLFLLLAAAVAFLGYSLTKHLKKAQRNADEGLFDPSEPRRPRRRQIGD